MGLQPRHRSLTLIGQIEQVVFRFLSSAGEPTTLDLTSRVDTGARSSALHAVNIQRFVVGQRSYVRFQVPLSDVCLSLEAPESKQAIVKAAGKFETRYFVEAQVLAGGRLVPIELSLTDRSSMQFPALLGRNFLTGRYVVDVSQSFLLDRPAPPLYYPLLRLPTPAPLEEVYR